MCGNKYLSLLILARIIHENIKQAFDSRGKVKNQKLDKETVGNPPLFMHHLHLLLRGAGRCTRSYALRVILIGMRSYALHVIFACTRSYALHVIFGSL